LTLEINTSYKEGRVEIPVTGLAPPHICGCPRPRPSSGPSKWRYWKAKKGLNRISSNV